MQCLLTSLALAKFLAGLLYLVAAIAAAVRQLYG